MESTFAEPIWPSAVIGLGLGAISFVIFIFIRRKDKEFFYPKALVETPWQPEERDGLFNWIPYVITYPEEKLLWHPGGVDSVKYLSFLRYTFWYYTTLTVIGTAVLIPVYWNAENNLPLWVDRLTISNIAWESNLFWVPIALCFVFSGLGWVLMWKLEEKYAEISNLPLAKGSWQTRSILIRHLPENQRSPRKLASKFQQEFPGFQVVHSYVIPDLKPLQKAIMKRHKFKYKYFIARDWYAEKNGKNPKRRKLSKKEASIWNSYDVDARLYWKWKVERSEFRINALRFREYKLSEGAVVTFASTNQAMRVAETYFSRDPLKWSVEPAPDPRGMIWESFGVSQRTRALRGVISTVLLAGFILFWTVPVTLISYLTTLANGDDASEFQTIEDFLITRPSFSSVLGGPLPAIILITLLSLSSRIIRAILKIRPYFHQKQLARDILRNYWVFLFYSVFLVASVAGSIFIVFEQVLEDTGGFIRRIGVILPSQAPFFIDYIALQGIGVYAVRWLLRAPKYLFNWKIKLAKKPRSFRMKLPLEDYNLYFGRQYGLELFVFCVGLAYGVLAPLILPFCAIFYGLAYFYAKNNWIYSFVPIYEGVHSTLSRIVIDRIFAGILVQQVFLIGVLASAGMEEGLVIIVAIAGTIAVRITLGKRYTNKNVFLEPENCPPEPEFNEELPSWGQRGLYQHPALYKLHDLDYDSDVDDDLQNEDEDAKPVLRLPSTV